MPSAGLETCYAGSRGIGGRRRLRQSPCEGSFMSNHYAEDDADIEAFCARQGINTQIVDGELTVDEEGMRQFADLALNPVRAHEILDQLLADAHSRDEDTEAYR